LAPLSLKKPIQFIAAAEKCMTAHGWTPQTLAAQLKGAFATSFTPLERSPDVFSWDPI
jgi:hypothetical protein